MNMNMIRIDIIDKTLAYTKCYLPAKNLITLVLFMDKKLCGY